MLAQRLPAATPTPCERVEVPPKITELRPAQAKPGLEVAVMATGGYFRDACGGYDESARAYAIYLDDEAAGSLACYVNRCEGKLRVPQGAAAGSHCLGVQKGTCQMEIVVVPG
jgi:hypothetical protein